MAKGDPKSGGNVPTANSSPSEEGADSVSDGGANANSGESTAASPTPAMSAAIPSLFINAAPHGGSNGSAAVYPNSAAFQSIPQAFPAMAAAWLASMASAGGIVERNGNPKHGQTKVDN